MKIVVETIVNQYYKRVAEGFNEDLFMALKPPLMPLELLRFDGCEKGDEVHIRLGKKPISTLWIAEIIENGRDDNEIYFIDIGKQLPFILNKWTHRHRIINKSSTETKIIDAIEYYTGFILLDFILYPLFYLQFLLRKPIYKRTFAENLK